jgi:hypothetical protein
MQNSDFLKDKFSDFHADVPEQVWDNVSDALDNKKKRRPVFWWFTSIAAILFLAIGAGVYWYGTQSNNNLSKNEFLSEIQHDTTAIQEKSTLNSEETLALDSENLSSVTATTELNSGVDAAEVKQDFNDPSNQRNQNEKENKIRPLKSDNVFVTNSIENTPNKANNEKTNLSFEVDKMDTISPAIRAVEDVREAFLLEEWLKINQTREVIGTPNFKARYWELSFSFGGHLSTRNNNMYLEGLGLANDPNQSFATGNADFWTFYETQMVNNIANSRYSLVRFGIGINRKLHRRIRLESGVHFLRYGLLANPQTWIKNDQMLQVPLHVHYSILKNKKLDWRLGTGTNLSLILGYPQPIYRSEWVNNTTLLYKMNPKWSVFVQPESRVVFFDSRIDGIGTLSKWYWGGNLGVLWRF